MSFTAWLKKQNNDNAIGDLARDVASDPNWPPCRTLAGFNRYLRSVNACEGAFEALSQAWWTYKKEKGPLWKTWGDRSA